MSSEKINPKTYEEYRELVKEARAKTREPARIYVVRIYKKLIALGFQPLAAGYQIEAENIWPRDTILEFLPDEAKHEQQSDAGRKSAQERKRKALSEKKYTTLLNKEALEEIWSAHMNSADSYVLVYTNAKHDFVSARPHAPRAVVTEPLPVVSGAPVRSP